MKKANIITSTFIIGISIFLLYVTTKIKDVSMGVLTPRTFPNFILYSIILLSLGILISNVSDKDDKEFIDSKGLKKVSVTIFICIVYILLLDNIGFLLSSAVLLSALGIYYYGKIDKLAIKIVVTSLIVASVVFYLFNNVFNVLLPKLL